MTLQTLIKCDGRLRALRREQQGRGRGGLCVEPTLMLDETCLLTRHEGGHIGAGRDLG